MDISIREEDGSALELYSRIPISFTVDRMLSVTDAGPGGITMVEVIVDPPYTKDYDSNDDDRPLSWARKWDISNWVVLSASSEKSHLGGAVVAWNTPGVFMLEGRQDLAVLWDIRVKPEYRGMGVGSRLFMAAEDWAAKRDCRWLKIETQNINVPACRFYVKQGCVLGSVNRFSYPELPDEVCLMWYKDLTEDRIGKSK